MQDMPSPPCLDDSFRSPEWIFEADRVRCLLTDLGFRPDLTESLSQSSEMLGLSAERGAFLKLAATWLATTGVPFPEYQKDFQTAIAVAALPVLMARHRSRGLPFAITAATARDLQRHMLESLENPGAWTISALNWFRNHVHRDLLEIGRLQYLPASFMLPYRIYMKETEGRSVLAFAEAGLDGTAFKRTENAPVFVTTFQEDGVMLAGHLADAATGHVASTPTRFRKSDVEPRLSGSMPVLDIHIPSGSGLSREACLDSLREASTIFTRYYPEFAWQAFVCTSWLLDRELWKCLPPESNIVTFAALFHPLAHPHATGRQIFERVLEGTENWRTFSPKTRLQRSVLRHLADGGTFRETSGVILRTELDLGFSSGQPGSEQPGPGVTTVTD